MVASVTVVLAPIETEPIALIARRGHPLLHQLRQQVDDRVGRLGVELGGVGQQQVLALGLQAGKLLLGHFLHIRICQHFPVFFNLGQYLAPAAIGCHQSLESVP